MPTRAAFPISRLSAMVLATIFFSLACGNSPSSSDAGGTGGVTATGGGGGVTSGSGGGAGGSAGSGGSSGGATGAGGKGGALGTGGQGGATGGAAGHGPACGTGNPCSTGQACVHPSCGGGVAVCERLPDGGQCPSGWTYTALCATGLGPGCVPPPCTPPTPFCADVPAACAGTLTCGCFPTNVCQWSGGSGGFCQFINSSEVMCASA